jgi:hypothetical protein
MVNAIDMSEVLGLFLGQLSYWTEEAQIDRLIAKPTMESLKRRNIAGANSSNGNVNPFG